MTRASGKDLLRAPWPLTARLGHDDLHRPARQCLLPLAVAEQAFLHELARDEIASRFLAASHRDVRRSNEAGTAPSCCCTPRCFPPPIIGPCMCCHAALAGLRAFGFTFGYWVQPKVRAAQWWPGYDVVSCAYLFDPRVCPWSQGARISSVCHPRWTGAITSRSLFGSL